MRPNLQLVPNDKATSNLSNLKRVKFLDPEFEAPVRQSMGQQKAAMSAEYIKKKENLDRSLQRVIDSTKLSKMKVLKKSAQ